jgi:hypothetical protein
MKLGVDYKLIMFASAEKLNQWYFLPDFYGNLH